MIRWGILGNATIARVCVGPAIAAARNGLVQAVGSRTLARAQALAAQVGGRAVEGYEQVATAVDVDAVYVPLPNHLHREWACRALAAGKHVLVEKPFALNAAEAAEMVATAADKGRFIMEAFMYRFHPRSRRIKALVDGGAAGRIRSVRTAFTFAAQRDGSNERLFLPQMGGGSLLDVGCYGVSVARWLLGREPVSVTAQAEWGESGVDLNFAGTLLFADGALATVESGLASTLQQTFSVVGEKRAIEVPHDAFVPWDKDTAFTLREQNSEKGESVIVPGADEYRLMVEHFGDVIAGKAAPLFAPDDSVRQMQVMDALKAAARQDGVSPG